MRNYTKLAFLWLAPLLLVPVYAFVRYLSHRIAPELIAAPSSRNIISLVLFESLTSPLWILLGFAFTYFLGGVAVVYVIRALASNKVLRRRFVISTKREGETISKIASSDQNSSLFFERLSTKSFGLCLALTLAINLVYTLSLQRYFQDIVKLPNEGSASIYAYLLSTKLIVTDFGLATLFLPLLTIVLPLFFGKISVRQIDASRFDLYWLSYVFSIAGGASLILFLFDVFETKESTEYFVIAILIVYGILSWYTAVGIILALPYAEQRLARELSKLQEESKNNKEEERNIIFGNLYAGASQQQSEKV